MTDPHRLEAGGWTLAHVRVSAPSAAASLTAGPDLSAPGAEPNRGAPRGIVGAVAQGIEDDAGQAASLALWGLIEGFFSARPTFGQGSAVAQALTAINGWMFATHGAEGLQDGLAASLSAITFSATRTGLIQVGAGTILRVRAGEATRLSGPQLHRTADGLRPRRYLGADDRILLDYTEEASLPGDRYILLSDARDTTPGAGGLLDLRRIATLCHANAQASALALALAGTRAVLVIDVLAVPAPSPFSADHAAQTLPLRPIPQEGDNRDGYLIGRTLHRGAYTLLKRATDTRATSPPGGQPVVIKFPLPAMLNDRVFQAGFARETWIGSTVHSPAIGRVIAPEPGRQSSLYIVMPFYRGETLEARIGREPRFAAADIAAIGLQLCQAVEDLRTVQVLHRDLKPDNVMLLPGGDIRLLDLGLAYLPQVEETAGNGLGGTIRYMAPELLRGARPDDTTEVYALGVILYRMAAFGRFPRQGADIAAVLERLRPDLPARLRLGIATALQLDAAKRPRSAAALAQHIGQSLQDDGGYRLAPRRVRDPLIVWRALAAVLGLALLAALALR